MTRIYVILAELKGMPRYCICEHSLKLRIRIIRNQDTGKNGGRLKCSETICDHLLNLRDLRSVTFRLVVDGAPGAQFTFGTLLVANATREKKRPPARCRWSPETMIGWRRRASATGGVSRAASGRNRRTEQRRLLLASCCRTVAESGDGTSTSSPSRSCACRHDAARSAPLREAGPGDG